MAITSRKMDLGREGVGKKNFGKFLKDKVPGILRWVLTRKPTQGIWTMMTMTVFSGDKEDQNRREQFDTQCWKPISMLRLIEWNLSMTLELVVSCREHRLEIYTLQQIQTGNHVCGAEYDKTEYQRIFSDSSYSIRRSTATITHNLTVRNVSAW